MCRAQIYSNDLEGLLFNYVIVWNYIALSITKNATSLWMVWRNFAHNFFILFRQRI